MVKQRFHIAALLKLIRWPNLIIIAAVQIMLRQCIMKPLASLSGIELQLTPVEMIMLVASTVFIAAGGYAINDYFDRRIDALNKPEKVVIGKLIYPHHVMAYHLIFTITGVITGTLLSMVTGTLHLSLVFFMVSGLLWFYSTTYKRQVILGTTIVSLLTALVPLVVLLFEIPPVIDEYGPSANAVMKNIAVWVSGFALFAFLLNFIREIVKDAEDYNGDAVFKKKTLPVVAGMRITKAVITIIIVFTLVLLTISYLYFVPDKYTLIYFLAFLAIPLVIAGIKVASGTSRQDFHKASVMVKMVIVMGILYMPVVSFIIKKLV